MARISPFRNAVPFWGQTTQNLSGLPAERDCSSKRVNNISDGGPKTATSNVQHLLQFPNTSHPFETAVRFWGQSGQIPSSFSPKTGLQFGLLRGTIVNRTYGIHKSLYISLHFTNNIWSYLLCPPVIKGLTTIKASASLCCCHRPRAYQHEHPRAEQTFSVASPTPQRFALAI